MASRRNIVPTAEISIAATVVDPSSLLFSLFSQPGLFFPPLFIFSPSLSFSAIFSVFFAATEYVRRKVKITQRRVKALIGPN